MSKEQKLETVELIADHTHKGEPLKPGAKIQVTAERKAWLIRHKKVADATPALPVAKAKE